MKERRNLSSFMAVKGINRRDLPQLLTPNFALIIKNFYVTGSGSLVKRSGITALATVAGLNSGRMIEAMDDNTLIYAYSDKLVAYDILKNSSTIIKTFSQTSENFSGERFGGYFLVTNGKEKIGRISKILNYDTQTANFGVGLKITGGTSGAVATILEDSDSGTTGYLTLGFIAGEFIDNEIITDSVGGSASVNGLLTYQYATITASPVCQIVRAIGSRLYAGDLESDSTAIYYSAAYTGTNPPFDNWTEGDLATDAGKLYYSNAGTVQDIQPFGENIVTVFASEGKWAFYSEVSNTAAGLAKIDVTVMQKNDFGGNAALFSEKGMFYVNSAGIWNLVSLGQTNVPFSEQEINVSTLLGDTFFQNIDFSNADIIYDQKKKLILITCAKDSAINNYVICYNLDFKAFSYFTGWNISKFCSVNGTIYGIDAIDSTIYKIFSGKSDNGEQIWCEFEQEINFGNLIGRKELKKIYVQGFLDASSKIEISYNIYNEKGEKINNKTSYLWQVGSSDTLVDGMGVASWGTASWGGDQELTGLIESFIGAAPRIANFQRLRINFKENSNLSLIINWFSLEGKAKGAIRNRKMLLTI